MGLVLCECMWVGLVYVCLYRGPEIRICLSICTECQLKDNQKNRVSHLIRLRESHRDQPKEVIKVQVDRQDTVMVREELRVGTRDTVLFLDHTNVLLRFFVELSWI